MRPGQQFHGLASVIALSLGLSGCGDQGRSNRTSAPSQSNVTATTTAEAFARTAAQRKAAYLNPPGQPPLGRPLDPEEERILSIDDPKTRAREALKAGKLSIAKALAYYVPDNLADAEWKDIENQVTAAEGAEVDNVLAAGVSPKIEGEWLPQVQKLSLSEPQSLDQVWKLQDFFDEMTGNLEEGRLKNADGSPKPDTPPVAVARRMLREALAAKQAQAFPIMRRAYIKLTAEKLWTNNVDVRPQAQGLIYTAAIFADNANVQTAEQAVAPDLEKLRFKTVAYNWYSGGRTWVYRLGSPPDKAIGIWGGGTVFRPVK
jgi:hypothetical protein